MSTTQQVIDLLQQAMALLGGEKVVVEKKPRAKSNRGGNKGLIKLHLQRLRVLAEMVEKWSKLPEAKRTEKTTETYTTKAGKEQTREVYAQPQPTYKDAISECKRRTDAGEKLPEVSEEDIDTAWRHQQEKKSGGDASASEAEVAEVPEPVAAPAPAPAPAPAASKAKKVAKK